MICSKIEFFYCCNMMIQLFLYFKFNKYTSTPRNLNSLLHFLSKGHRMHIQMLRTKIECLIKKKNVLPIEGLSSNDSPQNMTCNSGISNKQLLQIIWQLNGRAQMVFKPTVELLVPISNMKIPIPPQVVFSGQLPAKKIKVQRDVKGQWYVLKTWWLSGTERLPHTHQTLGPPPALQKTNNWWFLWAFYKRKDILTKFSGLCFLLL